jgi:hypothetical protein
MRWIRIKKQLEKMATVMGFTTIAGDFHCLFLRARLFISRLHPRY